MQEFRLLCEFNKECKSKGRGRINGVKRFYSLTEIDHLRKALEAEAARKEREIGDKNAPKPVVDEITDTTSSDPNTASTSSRGAGPIAGTCTLEMG